ncbi:MAG: patatin-like phospholipase family protein [Phycisphaerales bacterium]|jgi:hypothetical protein
MAKRERRPEVRCRALYSGEFARTVADLVCPEEPDRPLTVLAISGGGKFGAFSAGYLNGWTQRGDRPAFDVVTGISTGSLMAPLAFLGTAEADAALEEIYTTVTSDDVYKKRLWVQIPFSKSLLNAEPLKKLIEKHITKQVINAVAEQCVGRGLYVATVDLSDTRMVIWDMGCIAQAKDSKLFRRVLLAAAAVPMAFPPIKIKSGVREDRDKDRWHVDGGLRENVFWRRELAQLSKALEARRGDSSVPPATLYALVNGQLRTQYREVDFGWVPMLGIARRAVSTMISEVAIGSLQKLYAETLEAGVRFRFNYVREYDGNAEWDQFVPEEMRTLFEHGRELGLAGHWEERPPDEPLDG